MKRLFPLFPWLGWALYVLTFVFLWQQRRARRRAALLAAEAPSVSRDSAGNVYVVVKIDPTSDFFAKVQSYETWNLWASIGGRGS